MKFALGIGLSVLAQVVTFIQLQGQFKYEWMKSNPFLVSCIGIPLSYLYIYSVEYLVASFNGDMWPSRLIGFAIGAIVFTVMSKMWFGETLAIKTIICLLLACCIIFIQMYYK